MDSDNRVEAVRGFQNDRDLKSQMRFQDVKISFGECKSEALNFFRKSVCSFVPHKFPGYHPCLDDEDKNEVDDMAIVQRVCLGACIGTVSRCLLQKATSKSHQLVLYIEMYGWLLWLEMKQPKRNVGLNVEYWDAKEFLSSRRGNGIKLGMIPSNRKHIWKSTCHHFKIQNWAVV